MSTAPVKRVLDRGWQAAEGPRLKDLVSGLPSQLLQKKCLWMTNVFICRNGRHKKEVMIEFMDLELF